MQGEIDLFLPLPKLVGILQQCLVRKPVNSQLITTVLNYLKKISILTDGIKYIQQVNIIKPLLKLMDGGKEILEPVMRLLYNLNFDPDIKQELAQLDVYSKLDNIFLEINNDLMTKYASEYKDGTLAEKIGAISKNHHQH